MGIVCTTGNSCTKNYGRSIARRHNINSYGISTITTSANVCTCIIIYNAVVVIVSKGVTHTILYRNMVIGRTTITGRAAYGHKTSRRSVCISVINGILDSTVRLEQDKLVSVIAYTTVSIVHGKSISGNGC